MTNRINPTAFVLAVETGNGHVDEHNNLTLFEGAIHERHGRISPVNVSGSVFAAASAAVSAYNAAVR